MDTSFASWIFEQRLAQFGDKIDWEGLSMNPMITMDIVRRHMDKPWVWNMLAFSPYIPYDFILSKYPFGGENKHSGIWQSTTITIDHLVKGNATDYEWYNFSHNPKFVIDNAINHPDKNWDWTYISYHCNVTPKHITMYPSLPWEWKYVSKNPNITLDFVRSNPDKPWHWKSLSCHKNISMEEIIASKDEFPWNWEYVSLNPNLQLEHIIKHSTLPWYWANLLKHQNITLADIKKHDDLPWGLSHAHHTLLYQLNFNPNITLEDMTGHPKVDWQANFMVEKTQFNIHWVLRFPRTVYWYAHRASQHKNITWDDIKRHANLPWEWKYVSKNPNIMIDTIYHSKDNYKWNWREICQRPDFLEPANKEELRMFKAAKTICDQVFESMTNPSYKMCRSRINKDFVSLKLESQYS